MSRWERWCFNLLGAAVAISGAAYFWARYLLRSDDPFAVVNHPWQPGLLAVHIVASPLLVMLFGMVFRAHVLKKLASPRPPARRSGWTSLLCFGVMALSGYLLQVASSPGLVRTLVWVHVASSVLFVFGYAAHLVAGWRLPRGMADDTAAARSSRPAAAA